MSSFKDIPADEVKIDRSFIAALAEERPAEFLVEYVQTALVHRPIAQEIQPPAVEEMDFGTVLNESVDILVHYGLRIPGDIYLLAKYAKKGPDKESTGLIPAKEVA